MPSVLQQILKCCRQSTRETREVEGNGRRGDEHEPMGRMGKDKEITRRAHTCVKLEWRERVGNEQRKETK